MKTNNNNTSLITIIINNNIYYNIDVVEGSGLIKIKKDGIGRGGAPVGFEPG